MELIIIDHCLWLISVPWTSITMSCNFISVPSQTINALSITFEQAGVSSPQRPIRTKVYHGMDTPVEVNSRMRTNRKSLAGI